MTASFSPKQIKKGKCYLIKTYDGPVWVRVVHVWESLMGDPRWDVRRMETDKGPTRTIKDVRKFLEAGDCK